MDNLGQQQQQPVSSLLGARQHHLPPPEEVGNEESSEALLVDPDNVGGLWMDSPPRGGQSSNNNSINLGTNASITSVATLSSPWQYDDLSHECRGCQASFSALNRKHHCRLCGKIFCHSCSKQKALIPPSSIVLVPRGGKKVKPRGSVSSMASSSNSSFGMENANNSFAALPDPDPDRMLTYLSGGASNELLYGKGLEERFQLAREPLRVCRPCFQQLAPLQEDLRASNSNAQRFNHIDPTDPRRLLNSPLAHTLGHEIRKASYTLNNLLPLPKRLGAVVMPGSNAFSSSNNDNQHCKETCSAISPSLGDVDGVRIPARLVEQAKGIAVLTVLKGGFGLAGAEFGTGLVVARLPPDDPQQPQQQQRWSAPSAIGTAGLSWGALLGAQVSDHVFLLMTDSAVQMLFSDRGSIQLGADVGVALGPLGRALEGNVGASTEEVAPIYTYSMSKGFYAGVSLDGKVICTRNGVNERFYGRQVSGSEILAGAVPLPPAAQPLYEALARCHVYAGNSVVPSRSTAARRAVLAPLRPTVPGTIAALPPPPQQQQQQYPPPIDEEDVVLVGEYGEISNNDPSSPPHCPPLSTINPPAAGDAHSFAGDMSEVTFDPSPRGAS